MPTAPEVPIEYIAGVLDSNAVIAVVEVQDTELPRIMLHGMKAEVLQVLADATATKIVVTHRNYHRHACTSHCPPEHHRSQVKSISSRWTLTGSKATVVLAAVLPHLRAQQRVAREVLKVGLDAHRKPGKVTEMEALGWPIPVQWENLTPL